MSPVKIAVLRYTLRLVPDTEFHAKAMDFCGKFLKSTAQFFLVDIPVSQTAVIRISFSEPAVIHYKQLHAHISRFLCHMEKLFPCKIKISSFPVVDQNRTSGILKFSPAQSGLRRPEALSRKQLIAEIPRVDSHQNSCLIKLVLFYLSQKASAVKKRYPKAVSLSFCCMRSCQNHKRIILVTGGSS